MFDMWLATVIGECFIDKLKGHISHGILTLRDYIS